MKMVISAWLWLLISVVCPAAEIVAWKVPLEAYLYDGLKSEGVVRLEKPPEPSPFFGPADELWDLGEVPMEKRDRSFFVPSRLAAQPPMEWAVWNASTRRLVTKGGWNSVWQLHRELGIEQLPQMCRITLEVFEMKADGTPPNDKSIPISQLAWLSRSGGASEAVSPVRGHEIRAKVEATISDDSSVVDLRLDAVCGIPDQPEIVIETALSVVPEKRMWIARDADGEKGVDLTITAQIVLPDGSPYHERMMIQKGAEIRPINPYLGSFKRHPANGGQWLAVSRTDIDMIKSLEAEEEVDPFAELDPNAPPFVMAELKLDELDFPRELLGWVGGPAWDLRDAMVQNAVMTQDSPSVAGFNPELMILFLLSKDAVELDRFEQLFGWSSRVASNLAVSLEAGAQTTRVVCHSGQLAKFERRLDGKDAIRDFGTEPVISGDGQQIDLRFAYRDGPTEEPHRSCNLVLTVDAGIPVEVMTHRIAGELLPPLLAKVEVVGPSGEVEDGDQED